MTSNSKFKIQSSKFKIIVSLNFIFLILHFAFASYADAAYKIYLKNGSTIKGVTRYEKSEGEIKFYFEGGMVGIPEADILKIESSKELIKDIKPAEIKPAEELKEERTKAPEPETRRDVPGSDRPQETSDIKTQPADDIKTQSAEADKKAQEIAGKEAELRKIEGELLTTRARIQNLYINASSDAERSMLQQNMMRKRKLEAEKKKLEDELKALRQN
ncbi:MAG: hypothetical protein FD156_457 [Nitrospirae bacterium]|nr:MAG: hypothetical protein FD156_457 [Nitrospirota bacterium]